MAEWRKDAKAHGYKIDPETIDLARVVLGTNFRDTSAFRRAQARRDDLENRTVIEFKPNNWSAIQSGPRQAAPGYWKTSMVANGVMKW